MLLGTAAFATIVVQEVGGLAAMTDRVYEQFASGGPGGIRPNEILAFTPDQGKDVTATVLLLLGVLWLINSISDGSGYLAQRSMACRTDRDARTAAVVFTFTRVLVTSLLWVPLGIGLLVLFPPDPALSADVLQAEREATYIRGMAELLPVGVKGLMVTAMLAALASTVDTPSQLGLLLLDQRHLQALHLSVVAGEGTDRAGADLGRAGIECLHPGHRLCDHEAADLDQSGLADQPALRSRSRRGAGPQMDLVADERMGRNCRHARIVGGRAAPDADVRRQPAGAPAASGRHRSHGGGPGRDLAPRTGRSAAVERVL